MAEFIEAIKAEYSLKKVSDSPQKMKIKIPVFILSQSSLLLCHNIHIKQILYNYFLLFHPDS